MVKSLPTSAGDTGDRHQSLGWKSPWRRKCQPTPVFLPGGSHGQRSLVATVPEATKSQTWLSMHACSYHHNPSQNIPHHSRKNATYPWAICPQSIPPHKPSQWCHLTSAFLLCFNLLSLISASWDLVPNKLLTCKPVSPALSPGNPEDSFVWQNKLVAFF